jgi:hypothetical protein
LSSSGKEASLDLDFTLDRPGKVFYAIVNQQVVYGVCPSIKWNFLVEFMNQSSNLN